MNKKCFKCKLVKSLDQFYVHKQMSDGHLGKCKDCTKTDVRRRFHDPEVREKIREYDRARQRNNINRMFNSRYNAIASRHRGTATRIYKVRGLPIMSRQDFLSWCNEPIVMKRFMALHQRWEDSGYKRSLAPSIDRIDNSKSYHIGNLQWLSVRDNSSKGAK